MSRYFIHSILVLTLLIPIHANYSPKNPPPTSTSQRPSPSTDSFITTLSRMHRAYVSWQGDTTPSHHLADHMPSMHGTSTQAPPTMTKSALLAYKPTKHQHDTITYNIMDNTHDVPELFRDTHGYGATLMRAMSFPTHFLSDLDAESMVERMPFFTSSSTDTSTPTSDMTSSPSLSFHPLAIPTTSTKPYRSETLAFMTPSTLIVSGPDTSTLSIPILCYNCTSHHLSYMIRIYNITAIPGIDYVDVGTVTSIVMGNITYINITQGNDTISQSITTSNFTFPLIFNPYFRLSYLTPRKLTLKLFNITNLDTGVSNLPYGADMNTSSTDIYHTEIYHDIHILPAFPRVGFNYVDHNLTDLMTETTVQIDCQYCQGLDITVRLSTESVDSQAGIDFDETTATLIWLSRNGTIPNMTWTNTTIIPTRPPNDNGTIVPGSGQGGDDPAINNPDNGTDSSNTTYPNGTIPVTPVSPVEPYAPHVVVINLNDMDYKYGGIISQNITIPLHPRRSIRNQRHFHVRLFSGTATLAGLNLTSNSSYTPDGRLIWNNITLPVNFSIPLTIDPDQAEMIIMTTPYCGAGDLHYANRTVYVCNTTRYLPSEWKKQTSLNFNGTHLAGTNATCSNVISYFNLTSNNATHIAAIYQLCSPYLNGTNTTDNSNTTHNNSTISSIGGVRRLLQDTSSSSSSSSTGVDSGSSSIGNISSTGDGSFTGSSSNSSSGGSSSSDSGPSSSDLPSPTDPDLPRMCSLFAQCQYTNSCSPVAESTPVCYCPYNHYGPVCQYNTKIACTIGAVEPVMNTTTCKETNARLNNIYDIELEGSPPCYIMGKNRTYLSYYLDCRFDDTHQHIRQGPDEIELVRLTEGEYIWDKNTTLTNYSVMRLDPKTGEMLLAIREFVQPLLRVRIINFYRLSDISEQGASTVDLASLEDPYNVNNSISFWFRHADLSSSFTFAGRVYLEAHLVRTDKFPGPQVFPYHTMHLEIPDWKPPPYQPPSRLSSGAIAAIVIVVILIVLGALLAYYRYRLIRKKQEEAAKKNALRVPLLGEQMGMNTSIESSPPQSRIHQSSSSSAIPYQAVRSPASS